MSEETMFQLPEPQDKKPVPPTRPDQARTSQPTRNQVEWAARDLDSMLPRDHIARTIWTMLEQMDLAAFYASIQAVVGGPGRAATDPQVLLALWAMASLEEIGSARHLARLCEEHDAFRWIRGGVPINYHMLSDFRVGQQEAMNDLLTKIVAAMAAEGFVKLSRVAQDGMRVRASAGAASFHRRESAEKAYEQAKELIDRLAKERENPDPDVNRRQRAARERAAREREIRVKNALDRLPELEAAKERQEKTLGKARRAKVTKARVSTTDPDARVMKMADGGFRPAFNMEIASDVDNQVIVGVSAITEGSDAGQAGPMVEQIEKRTEDQPDDYLIDGGFVNLDDITKLEQKGIKVYAPTRPPRTDTSGRTQFEPRPGDTPEVAGWRGRMGTDEAKEIYKQRAATAECVNAHARRYGLRQLTVRGVDKALSVLLIMAITYDLMRWIALRG